MAKKLFLTLKHVIFLMRLKHRQQKNQRLKFQNNRLKLLAYLQLKKHVQHSRVLINEVKQKVESIMKKSTSSFLNEPTEKVFPASEVPKIILDKAHCFDHLVDLVKAKLVFSSNKQQIKLLTLALQTWGVWQVVEVFETNDIKRKRPGNFYNKRDCLQSPKVTKENAFLIILLQLCNLSIKMTCFQDVYQEQRTLLIQKIRSICENG